MILKILALGDVVGPKAVEKIKDSLWSIRKDEKIDFVVINGENAADGGGMDIKSTQTLINAGADAVTAGNHTFKRREIREYLDDTREVIRPCNFPDEVSGTGYTLINAQGITFLVINVLGTVFMESLACPFRTVEKILGECFFDLTNLTPDYSAECYKTVSDAESRTIIRNSVYRYDEESIFKELRMLECPVLILWGCEDKWHTSELPELYHAAIKNASYAIVRNAGHLLHEEKADRVAALVNEYIAPVSDLVQ